MATPPETLSNTSTPHNRLHNRLPPSPIRAERRFAATTGCAVNVKRFSNVYPQARKTTKEGEAEDHFTKDDLNGLFKILGVSDRLPE